jgi:hypothetical protein
MERLKGKSLQIRVPQLFVSLTLFPRLEVMFRYTHEFYLRVNPNTGYFPDRMFSIRWQIRKESSKFPAVLLGLQDVSAAFNLSCKSCVNFSATYVVTTKKFKTNLFTIHLSAGYASDFNGLVARDYKGLFGGIELQHKKIKRVSDLAEYDSYAYNIGIKATLFKHLYLMTGLRNMEALTGIVAFKHQLF